MRWLIGIWILFYSMGLRAEGSEPKLQRVGGRYKIASIEKLDEANFRIRFTSQTETGRFDQLILKSDHIHLSMQEGQVVRLSAEVIDAPKGQEVEVTQVLLFLSNPEYGTTPVWLLSSQHPTREFRGSRWLDMHAPQADFLIL